VIVIDTSALLAILNGARDRFLDILAGDDAVVLSAVTLYEAMLVAAARRGADSLDDLAALLETVQAEIVAFDAAQARASQAAYMRYGNAFTLLVGDFSWKA
jgi:ribonuclease VapC